MIYLDDSSTTKVDKEILDSMIPYYLEYYGNASSTHSFGQKSKYAIDEARYIIADFLQCTPQEIIFTSTGSESISLAIKGTAEYLATQDNKFIPENVYIITTPLEHSSVHKTIMHLGFWGYKNKVIAVESDGRIKLENEENSLRSILEKIRGENSQAKILISVQYVNSEIGTIQNLPVISKIAHEYGAIVHTDAMQAAKLLDVSIPFLGVDLLTMASHKIYGPIGVAILYIKAGSKISRQIDGGDQEYKIRAGTQNVPAIVGFGKAVKKLKVERNERHKKINKLSDIFVNKLKDSIPDIRILAEDARMQSIHACVFPNILSTEFLVRLDMSGIMASAGSACNSGSIQPTANLAHIGLADKDINSVIRFSLGKDLEESDVLQAVEIIVKTYNDYINSKEVNV